MNVGELRGYYVGLNGVSAMVFLVMDKSGSSLQEYSPRWVTSDQGSGTTEKGPAIRGQGGNYRSWGYAGKLFTFNGLREECGEESARRRLFGISLASKPYFWRSLGQKIPMRTIKDMTIETRKVVLDETELDPLQYPPLRDPLQRWLSLSGRHENRGVHVGFA